MCHFLFSGIQIHILFHSPFLFECVPKFLIRNISLCHRPRNFNWSQLVWALQEFSIRNFVMVSQFCFVESLLAAPLAKNLRFNFQLVRGSIVQNQLFDKDFISPGGGALVFQSGYHPRKRTFKAHPKHIFLGMKIEPKYTFLHAFFLICISCPFQTLSIWPKTYPFLQFCTFLHP